MRRRQYAEIADPSLSFFHYYQDLI